MTKPKHKYIFQMRKQPALESAELNSLLYRHFNLPTAQQLLISWVERNPLGLSDKQLLRIGEDKKLVDKIVSEVVQYIASNVRLYSNNLDGYMLFEDNVIFQTCLSQLILYIIEKPEKGDKEPPETNNRLN